MPVDPAPPRIISTKVYNRDRRDKGSSRCSDWSGGHPYSGDSSPPRERHSLADFPSPTQDLRHDGCSTGRRSRPIPAANTRQVCCVAGRGEADELSMLVEEAGLCAVSSAPAQHEIPVATFSDRRGEQARMAEDRFQRGALTRPTVEGFAIAWIVPSHAFQTAPTRFTMHPAHERCAVTTLGANLEPKRKD
jgi:hypothetical protein